MVDHLFAIEPGLDVTGISRSKTDSKAEIEPTAAKVPLFLVQDDAFAVKVLGDAKETADIADRKDRAVVRTRGGLSADTVLFPLRDD